MAIPECLFEPEDHVSDTVDANAIVSKQDALWIIVDMHLSRGSISLW